MQNFFDYIMKVSRNAVLRPFRLLYRQIRKKLFLKNRVGRFIKGAVKGIQKSVMYKPDSKQAYIKLGRKYLSKRFLIVLLLVLILLPLGYIYLVMPWAAGKLYRPTYAITDDRVKGFSGKVHLVTNTGRGLYRGSMQDGFAQGFGILYDKEGHVRYEGDFKQDQYDGQGKLYMEETLVYEGAFSANLFEGRGKAYYENGIVAYDGSFVQGAYDGEGKLYRPDGSLQYKGDFQAGLYHGFGIELDENGQEIYKGSYALGKRSGSGEMYRASGSTKYDGEFAGGLPSGQGLMYHDNGRLRYKGNFDKGVFEGAGKLYTQEGRVIYEGDFVGGAYDGSGQLFRPNGRTYYEGGFRTGLFEGKGELFGVLGNTLYSGGFHRGEFDIVPLIGSSLAELGSRFNVTPETVPQKDDGSNYVIDYDPFNFSVRSRVTDEGPVIDGFVFYGAQNYLDINSGNPDEEAEVQVQGPKLSTEWVNPFTEYDWIMEKNTPLLDKDGDSTYGLETYEYEGLLITITRNMTTGDILLYEIGVVADES